MSLLSKNIQPIVAALIVFVFSVIGNVRSDYLNQAHPFPDFLTFGAFISVLLFIIWLKHRDDSELTIKQLFLYGEKIVRKTALIFVFLLLLHTIYLSSTYLGHFSMGSIVIFGIIILPFVYLSGLLIILAGSYLLKFRQGVLGYNG